MIEKSFFECLEKLYQNFLSYSYTNVDTGKREFPAWNNSSEMEQTFRDCVEDRVNEFFACISWEEDFTETMARHSKEEEQGL
ncbi:hypothetical protein [Microcoleus sp.]|uniref:hypothetical protein n=1 Tax=Microcoleus sp. TaxID=44472 RepID=UPI003525F27B